MKKMQATFSSPTMLMHFCFKNMKTTKRSYLADGT